MSKTIEATLRETVSGRGVRGGADEYGRLLGAAGGTELSTLMGGGDRSTVCAAIYRSPPYDLQVPLLPVSRLSVNLTRARVSGGLAGERHRSFEADRYSLFLAPASAPMNWCKDSPSRHLTIYFHADAFDRSDEAVPLFQEAQPIFNASAPGIRSLADQLVGELDCASFLNVDAADSLARLLLVRFARHWRHASTSSHRLSSAVLARLRDYVMEHLTERILVADLAKQAGLPPNRFAVAYREQTGQSPHQFVLALRLKHAAELLRHSTLGLANLAQACGFANQQHLSNAMRRFQGTTPGRYRAQQRSGLPLR